MRPFHKSVTYNYHIIMSFANESLLECIFRVLHSSLLAFFFIFFLLLLLFLMSSLFVYSSSDVYRVIWRPAKNRYALSINVVPWFSLSRNEFVFFSYKLIVK